MRCNNYKTTLCCAVLVCSSLACSCSGAMIDVNDFFKIGDCREIQVAIPKRGYLGAPWFPGSSLYGPKTVPIWDKDFSKRYMRITVLYTGEIQKGQRVWLRLDEIDANGVVLTYEDAKRKIHMRDLYYAALDVTPNESRLVGFSSSPEMFRNKYASDLVSGTHGTLNRGAQYGLPFPLAFTCPPLVSPDRTLRESSWMCGEYGVKHIESIRVEEGRKITAVLFRKVYPSLKVKDEDVRYYSNEKKELSSGAGPDSVKVVITDAETQFWADPNDWLWQTMDRTDAEGHITMRCKQIRTPYKQDDKPAD